jgi:hypothetical protein
MPSMPDCPKYKFCNAPVCPLDPAWARRLNSNEDPTCFYLCESVKDGSEALFQGAGLEELYACYRRCKNDPLTPIRK